MITNALLLACELAVTFGVLTGLFHFRRLVGIGVFFTALGTMHVLETVLAASVYVEFAPGMVSSPGSSVLFAGKIVMLLLVYVREDAGAARQPIYGLLAGGLLTVALVEIVRAHAVAPAPGPTADLAGLAGLGALMVWSSFLLLLDAFLIVLVYERLGRVVRIRTVRIWLALASVLTFDQLGFYAALHALLDAPVSVLAGGWAAKMASGLGYAVLVGAYLRLTEGRAAKPAPQALSDLLGTLTFRESYRALLDQSGRDPTTGALNRSRLELQGRQALDLALSAGECASLILVHVEPGGGGRPDAALLRRVAAALQDRVPSGGYLFWPGGGAFLLTLGGRAAEGAMALAEDLRAAAAGSGPPGEPPVAAAIGVASGPWEGDRYDALLDLAQGRLRESRRIRRGHAVSVDQMRWAAAVPLPRRLVPRRPAHPRLAAEA